MIACSKYITRQSKVKELKKRKKRKQKEEKEKKKTKRKKEIKIKAIKKKANQFKHPVLVQKHIFHCMKSVQICSYFWFVFSCIRTEYGDLQSKSPYSVRIQENTDQK